VTDDRGATLVEYALLVALIAVVVVASLFFFGNNRDNSLSRSGSAIFTGAVLFRPF
jgi:Flp pilus assembly pilin Flp